MKLSFSTLGCPEWGFADILATAKDLGYDGIEFRGVLNTVYTPDVREFSDGMIERTKAKLSRLAIAIPCLTSAAYLHSREHRAEAMREARDYIDLAEKLSCPYVRVLGDTNPAPGAGVDDGFVREGLAEAAEYGEKRGVMPLIETNGVYSDTARLRRTVAGLSNVGVVWDIHHPMRFMGEPAAESFDNISEYVRHVHLKDSVMEEGALHYMPLSHGDVPFTDAIGLLASHGYAGYYSLEWVRRWDKSLESAGIAFAQYINYMKHEL